MRLVLLALIPLFGTAPAAQVTADAPAATAYVLPGGTVDPPALPADDPNVLNAVLTGLTTTVYGSGAMMATVLGAAAVCLEVECDSTGARALFGGTLVAASTAGGLYIIESIDPPPRRAAAIRARARRGLFVGTAIGAAALLVTSQISGEAAVGGAFAVPVLQGIGVGVAIGTME